MKHPGVFLYQCIAGLSDAFTGMLLCVAPQFTLRLMGLHATGEVSPYVAYIGAFVFSVGMSYLYGAYLTAVEAAPERVEVVWLLTGFARSAVSIYVLKAVLLGSLETGWLTVALFDGACVVIQAIGLRKRWLFDAR